MAPPPSGATAGPAPPALCSPPPVTRLHSFESGMAVRSGVGGMLGSCSAPLPASDVAHVGTLLPTAQGAGGSGSFSSDVPLPSLNGGPGSGGSGALLMLGLPDSGASGLLPPCGGGGGAGAGSASTLGLSSSGLPFMDLPLPQHAHMAAAQQQPLIFMQPMGYDGGPMPGAQAQAQAQAHAQAMLHSQHLEQLQRASSLDTSSLSQGSSACLAQLSGLSLSHSFSMPAVRQPPQMHGTAPAQPQHLFQHPQLGTGSPSPSFTAHQAPPPHMSVAASQAQAQALQLRQQQLMALGAAFGSGSFTATGMGPMPGQAPLARAGSGVPQQGPPSPSGRSVQMGAPPLAPDAPGAGSLPLPPVSMAAPLTDASSISGPLTLLQGPGAIAPGACGSPPPAAAARARSPRSGNEADPAPGLRQLHALSAQLQELTDAAEAVAAASAGAGVDGTEAGADGSGGATGGGRGAPRLQVVRALASALRAELSALTGTGRGEGETGPRVGLD